jgi:hypothetical protein
LQVLAGTPFEKRAVRTRGKHCEEENENETMNRNKQTENKQTMLLNNSGPNVI